MSEIKFECPNCTQHIAVPEELVGTEIECPGCSRRVKVRRMVCEPSTPSASMKTKPNESQRLHNEAVGYERGATIFGAIMWLCLICTLFFRNWTCVAAASGFLTLYLATKIIAQLMHIRALLHQQQADKPKIM